MQQLSVEAKLRKLAERWATADAGERANAQLYLTEFTAALDVPQPQPKGSGYEFELAVPVVNRDGSDTTEFADLFKEGCFLLEAKDQDSSRSNELLLRAAYGQARSYVSHVPGGLPPYILVLDVGRTLMVWDRWSGTYGGFQAGRKIDLRTFADRPQDIALLRDIWLQPEARDPRKKANAVTKEIAGKLAQLASSLEERGHDQEGVAKFLIRCVFTMFAEDVGLLKDEPFLRAVRDIGMNDPDQFRDALQGLWSAMNEGKWFGIQKILWFNGHFFREQEVLPLTREDLGVLLEAARADWQFVEPAILGTLLVRALDPAERHRLGAQFTPREFVERLIRPTIEQPVRERWTAVEGEVIQLLETGKKADRRKAVKQLEKFHAWLRSLKILDPACGSGNFLYVAMQKLKEIEAEVIRSLEQITQQTESGVEEVSPAQFYGLEVKHWSREIAELTLWIGYHQFWIAEHGQARTPPEPVLKDIRTFEVRDAVLAWDSTREDPKRAVPDPTPRLQDPVTGELVPDPAATLPYVVHESPRPAPWPEADFVVGNPPYMGVARQRAAFGDGYVAALRAAYPGVPDSADYVMYWWYRAAQEVAAGRAVQAGLITTSSITQTQNRAVLAQAMKDGVQVVWTIPDHPWVDEAGAADVRVAMTVIAKAAQAAIRVEVDDDANVVRQVSVQQLNADLTTHADVAKSASRSLLSNSGIASDGVKLHGRGFVLTREEAEQLLKLDPAHAKIVRPYRNGRDIAQRPRGVYVIDFGLATRGEAEAYPVLYDIIRSRVKPSRDANKRASYRKYWWRFGEPRREWREAVHGLRRYIITVDTAKHRFFRFIDSSIVCDDKLVCIASDDAFFLGVLSSRVHTAWALAAGGRLGVGNDPVYVKTRCFDPFPFPVAPTDMREGIADIALKLDRHRKQALDRDPDVTMTGIYNVLQKLQNGESLTPAERKIHDIAACGVLLDLHTELDRVVALAYSWPWPLEKEEILERLVKLHAERVTEEERGRVHWLRPDYQIPKLGERAAEVIPELELAEQVAAAEKPERPGWPAGAAEQITAVQEALADAPGTFEEIARRFHNATRRLVERHLETLVIMGEARRTDDGRYHSVESPPEAYAA